MRRVSMLVLLVGFVRYTFAGIHHDAHGYRHRHLMQPTEELEPRNPAWDNVNNTPDDFVVESITLTTTTTVFGNCAPTNIIHSTLTLVKHRPQPTPCRHGHAEPYQDHWDQREPQLDAVFPVPTNTRPVRPQFTQAETWAFRPTDLEGTITIVKTQTITKTATNTVRVTVYPGATAVPLANTFPGIHPKTEKAVALANTLPKGTLKEEKAVPAEHPHAPLHKSNDNPINAILHLPGEFLPDLPLPLVNQILPGPSSDKPTSLDWTATPPGGQFSRKGFGGRTPSRGKGTQIHYMGNIGMPWGSNIITVSPIEAHTYKYVVQFTGSKYEPWTLVVWNKFGPDGMMTGWYGHSALTFTLAPGETRYVAFDEDSEGAWGAAPGDHLPTDRWGGYSCTWGEFTFGDGENNGWSGWDVSAIQAQIADQPVQGMSICQADGKKCSIITPGAKQVVNSYVYSKKHLNGIGGEAAPGPVRLNVLLDYQG
ncbi:uncharacterized protein N7479_003890 [Penicillium vulpinum]|uniref:Allergen Asp f 4 n=1 Tax=Penicillium vulpinum TaxID=29845 RepID=A0A1V6RH27_9EURO|nr:uncharacterized protein N7479_003890 [Penicillium vulpinum]KAJ5964014.1 hypothetical protein N7479_003890 [Penicillium vulpinum]OQE00850.1 hypothetical protein PENVUL_c045G01233 [Penicillium vulpinum]